MKQERSKEELNHLKHERSPRKTHPLYEDIDLQNIDFDLPEFDLPDLNIEIPEIDIPDLKIDIPDIDLTMPDFDNI